MKPIAPMILVLLTAAPAHAGSSEIRFGAFGHDIGFLGHGKEGGIDVNAELLFDAPDVLRPIWAPRPHLGLNVNTDGDTSQAYAGLTWTFTPVSKLFIDISLGGSIHDGKLADASGERKELGSRVLFRESLSVGYRFDERNSISIAFDHESNANLADNNEGLNNLGIRWGYRF